MLGCHVRVSKIYLKLLDLMTICFCVATHVLRVWWEGRRSFLCYGTFPVPPYQFPPENPISGGYLAVQLENNPYSYLKIASSCQNGLEPTQAASTLVRTWLLET